MLDFESPYFVSELEPISKNEAPLSSPSSFWTIKEGVKGVRINWFQERDLLKSLKFQAAALTQIFVEERRIATSCVSYQLNIHWL